MKWTGLKIDTIFISYDKIFTYKEGNQNEKNSI